MKRREGRSSFAVNPSASEFTKGNAAAVQKERVEEKKAERY